MYGWFDLNHFSWAGSDLSGSPVIRWSVSSKEALPGGTSGAHSLTQPPLEIYLVAICEC